MAVEYCGTGKIIYQLLRGALALPDRTEFLVYVWLAYTSGSLALEVFPETLARGRDRYFDTGNHTGSI